MLAAGCVPWDYPVPLDDAEHTWSQGTHPAANMEYLSLHSN